MTDNIQVQRPGSRAFACGREPTSSSDMESMAATENGELQEKDSAEASTALAAVSSSEDSEHDSGVSLSNHISSLSLMDHDDEDENSTAFDDNDSAFGGSLVGLDTDSLQSYITNYTYENGRRYHGYRDGEYWVRQRLSDKGSGLPF